MDSEQNSVSHKYRDYLMKAIRDIRNEIELIRKENDILGGFKAELVKDQIEEISEINVRQLFKEIGKQIDTKDVSIQTEPILTRSTSFNSFAYSLIREEKLLMKRLSDIKLATNHKGPNCLLVKQSEFRAFLVMIMSAFQMYERTRNKVQKLHYYHRPHH